MYLWLKAFHVIFMVTWFAGLFNLPRVFVYHAMDENKESYELFKIQEKRLFGIMTLGAILTVIFAIILFMMNANYLIQAGWFHMKLLFILGLFGYHYWCYRIMVTFRKGENTRSSKWYRWFNEAPVIPLIGIIVLVIVKPF